MNLKKLSRGIVGLLIVEFLLGLLAASYQEISADNPTEVFHQFGFIMFHVLTAGLLLVLGGMFLYQSAKQHAFTREARSGMGAMVGAFVFGELFVFTQNDVFTIFMALAFVGALLPYAKVMYTAK